MNDMTTAAILLSYGYVTLPKVNDTAETNRQLVGTFVSNMAYYGYVPSKRFMQFLNTASQTQLSSVWKTLEASLKANSGEGRDIGKHIVYKNFPKEVLEMSQAEYWLKQILMYIGFEADYFRQEEAARDALFETVTMKVIHVADENAAYDVFQSLLSQKTRWTDIQTAQANHLLSTFGQQLTVKIDMDSVGFKENGINAVVYARHRNLSVDLSLTTATDVLRLAAGLSGADISLRENVTFKRFKRAERRLLLTQLEATKNLEDDFAARKDVWKKFMMVAHPGDYAKSLPRVVAAYDKLYKGEAKSFAAKVDKSVIRKGDLALLASRPGEFLRRFHTVYDLFGVDAVNAFVNIVDKLTTHQLVKFRKYLDTITFRKELMYAPKGNWTKVKIEKNEKGNISQPHRAIIGGKIDEVIAQRIGAILPEGVDLDFTADFVKLPTNDQKLAAYGRGTVFPIPDGINFIRSASYWQAKGNSYSSTWMDNGWNFFDSNWNATGTICWNHTSAQGAAFSGDPLSSKTADGKACQVIDLYIDQLVKRGVRYAVWNVLSYNNVPFDSIDDVFASLQWGVDAFSGKVYEPSRAQMEFPIKGANKTKYIAYVDLVERKLVYMDANFKGNVSSAGSNQATLTATMPAYVEYLHSLPSVFDLFQSAPVGSIPVTFSDAGLEIEGDKAYVFRPENPDNEFQKIDLTAILA